MRTTTAISASEVLHSQDRLISTYQRAHYPNEYMTLSAKKPISSNSTILSLNPFIDGEGIMRISGRLELASNLSYNEKHPIIMPYNSQYSRLLVRFVRKISLHGGNQLVLRLIRSKYWIPKVKNLVFYINKDVRDNLWLPSHQKGPIFHDHLHILAWILRALLM